MVKQRGLMLNSQTIYGLVRFLIKLPGKPIALGEGGRLQRVVNRDSGVC